MNGKGHLRSIYYLLLALAIIICTQPILAQSPDDDSPTFQVAKGREMLPVRPPQLAAGVLPPPNFSGETTSPQIETGATLPEPPDQSELEALLVENKISFSAYQESVNSLQFGPNLFPYVPSGWDSPVVLSESTGTTTNSDLHQGANVYVDWAVGNGGDSTSNTFYSCLYVDSVAIQCWSASGLAYGYYTSVTDWLLTVSPAAGWHTVGLWTDVYDQVLESDEYDNYWSAWFYWYPSGGGINLSPYTPSGWDYPVVPASEPGSSGDSRLYSDSPTYFDVAFANYGDTAASSFDTCLYIDNVSINCWSTGLAAGSYASVEDYQATVSQTGWHTVTLKVDVNNAVGENNENDNTWEGSFYWEVSDLPNLYPYQPDGWDNGIVPSSQTGTHVVDTLVGGSPTYIDWAVINGGWGDINQTFKIGLYLDGTLLKDWLANELQSGWYGYIEDYTTTIAAGWHSLEIRADIDNAINETNENDNTLAVDFFWQQGGNAPEIRVEPTAVSIQLSTQSLQAMMPTTLQRDTSRIQSFDPTLYGTGAELTPPNFGIYPRVPLAPTSPGSLLAAVDLSSGLPPIGNQLNSPSCVGWSSSYYMKSYQEGVDQGWSLTDSAHQFSPNYVWNQIQTSPGQCTGTWPGAAMQLIANQGTAPFSVFGPFTESCSKQPTLAHRDVAANYRAENFGSFFRLGGSRPTDATINQMKQWLASGDPILLAIPVMPEFDNPSGTNCIVDLPNQGSTRGGHAITIVGYDDNIGGTGLGGFKIVNSWGTVYGCNGFAYITYRWIKQLADEAWWMRDIRTGGNTSRDFTIFNDGNATLTVSDIREQSGSAWLELVLPHALPIRVEPGQSKTVELTINGQGLSAGTYNETIQITSNDSDENVTSVNVTLQVGVPSGTPPGQASNPSPSNGASDQTTTLSLSWQSAGSGLVYDVRLDQSNPPSQIVCNDRTTTSCTVSNLKKNTTYYWRVVASDGLNVTLGPVWQFTTGTAASRVYLPLVIKGY